MTQLSIAKIDTDRRIVYGHASVISEGGRPVVDLQGDVITPAELHAAVDEFLKSSRDARLSHTTKSVGTVLHSLVLTKDIQDALGISVAGDRETWVVGMHIADDAVWKSIKDGTSGLNAFSIAGTAIREEINE